MSWYLHTEALIYCNFNAAFFEIVYKQLRLVDVDFVEVLPFLRSYILRSYIKHQGQQKMSFKI